MNLRWSCEARRLDSPTNRKTATSAEFFLLVGRQNRCVQRNAMESRLRHEYLRQNRSRPRDDLGILGVSNMATQNGATRTLIAPIIVAVAAATLVAATAITPTPNRSSGDRSRATIESLAFDAVLVS